MVLRNKCHRIIPRLKLFCVSSRRFRGNHTAIFASCCSFWRTLKNASSFTGPLKPLTLLERTLSNDDDDGDDGDYYYYYYYQLILICNVQNVTNPHLYSFPANHNGFPSFFKSDLT